MFGLKDVPDIKTKKDSTKTHLLCEEIRIYKKPESFNDYYDQFTEKERPEEDSTIIKE